MMNTETAVIPEVGNLLLSSSVGLRVAAFAFVPEHPRS